MEFVIPLPLTQVTGSAPCTSQWPRSGCWPREVGPQHGRHGLAVVAKAAGYLAGAGILAQIGEPPAIPVASTAARGSCRSAGPSFHRGRDGRAALRWQAGVQFSSSRPAVQPATGWRDRGRVAPPANSPPVGSDRCRARQLVAQPAMGLLEPATRTAWLLPWPADPAPGWGGRPGPPARAASRWHRRAAVQQHQRRLVGTSCHGSRFPVPSDLGDFAAGDLDFNQRYPLSSAAA